MNVVQLDTRLFKLVIEHIITLMDIKMFKGLVANNNNNDSYNFVEKCLPTYSSYFFLIVFKEQQQKCFNPISPGGRGGALSAWILFILRLLFFLVGNVFFYYLTFIVMGLDSF